MSSSAEFLRTVPRFLELCRVLCRALPSSFRAVPSFVPGCADFLTVVPSFLPSCAEFFRAVPSFVPICAEFIRVVPSFVPSCAIF